MARKAKVYNVGVIGQPGSWDVRAESADHAADLAAIHLASIPANVGVTVRATSRDGLEVSRNVIVPRVPPPLQTGVRGGTFYIGPSGMKVYVNK